MIFLNDPKCYEGVCQVQIGNRKGYDLSYFNPKSSSQSGSGLEDVDETSNGPPYIVGSGRLHRWSKRLVAYGRKHLPGIARQIGSLAKKTAKVVATDIASEHGSDIAREAASTLTGALDKRGAPKFLTGLAQAGIENQGKRIQAGAKKQKQDLNFGERQISDRSKSLLRDILAKRAEGRAGITKGNGISLLGKGINNFGSGSNASNSFDSTIIK